MLKNIIKLSLFLFAALAQAAPTPAQDVWKPVADKVCDQIKQSIDYYQKNDIKQAHATAIMAYFKGYDAEIEPAVRITLGGPHVFAVERQFRDLSTLMTPTPSKEQFKKVADFGATLCESVYADAKALNADHVPRQVFKVE